MTFFSKFLVGIFTFALGVTAFLYLAPLPNILPVQYDVPVDVTVAALAYNPKKYDGRLVNLRGRLHLIDNEPATLSDDGSGPDWLWVICKEGYSSCVGLLEDIREGDPDTAEIIFTGRFISSPVERENGIPIHFGLVQIIETRGFEVKGGRPLGTAHREDPCIEMRLRGESCGTGSANGEGPARR